jgi:hypothetical protein
MMRTMGSALAVVALTAAAARAQEAKTYFDYVESAFAVAEVKTATPMEYRDGMLLTIPGQLVDVVYARVGKPHTIMLVFEKRSKDDKPLYGYKSTFFAPIQVLPQYSFWRDNLPKTPHHGVLGGGRYIFRGDEIEEAKRITRPYTDTLARKRVERWPDQASALVGALHGSIAVLREDAGRKLAASPQLLEAMRPEAQARLGEFLSGNAPEEERVKLIDGIGAAQATGLSAILEGLSKRDDATGAAALRALQSFGKRVETASLLELAAAKDEHVRAFAVETLGARSGQDRAALDAVTRCLKSDEPESVRAAAARGLGNSGAADAIEPLAGALGRGDGASQAAAKALAQIGGPQAAQALKDAITSGPGGAQTGAVIAMVDLRGPCTDCLEFLREQHARHPDEGIRELIAIVLQLDHEHKH